MTTLIDGEVEHIDPAPELCECGRPKGHRGRHTKALAQESPERGASVRGSHWGEKDVAKLTFAFESILMGATAGVEAKTGVDGATFEPQEAHEVAEPMATIVARHWRIPKAKQGDVADLCSIGGVMGGYFMRIWALQKMMKNGSKNGSINGFSHSANPDVSDPLARYRQPS